jgi:hypothetical protein
MSTPLPITFEAFYSGQWHDITADVRLTDDVEITWGRADESSQAAPTTIEFQLNNGRSEINPAVLGRYSLKNPRSDLFGLIGRNMPVRVRLGDQQHTGLLLPGHMDGYASNAYNPLTNITGDIDIRIDIEPETWRPSSPGGGMALARKYMTTSNQRAWVFTLGDDGRPGFMWSPDGTLAARIVVDATAAVPDTSGRLVLRVTLDVDNGASGNTVRFYTGLSITGPWTQVGADVVTSGVTSIASTTLNTLEIGRTHSTAEPGINTTMPFSGGVHAFQLRAGINGAVRAFPDFDALDPTPRVTFFTDSVGRGWVIGSRSYVDDTAILGIGEVAKMPTEWDTSGNNVWVPVEAKGISRRLGQGKSALRSPLFRDLSRSPDVVAYWPMEDGANATQLASAFGHEPLVLSGDVRTAAYDGFAGSGPVTTFGNIAHASGTVPAYTPLSRQRWALMLHQSASQPADRNLIYTTCTGGTVAEAVLVLKADGSLRLVLNNRDGVALLDFAGGLNDLRDQNAIVWFFLRQVGTSLEWQIGAMKEDEGVYYSHNGSLANQSYGRFTTVKIGAAGELSGAGIGHATLFNSVDDGTFWATAATSLRGWAGEPAGERIARLSGEEGVPMVIIGDPSRTERMGRQGIDTYLNLVQECANTDMGILDDHHRLLARRYLTREARYNRTDPYTMDYAAKQVPPPLRPVPDDQATRNDITVERIGGSSFRVVQTTGPLNVNDPTDDPDGVGVYDDAPKLSLASDSQLRGQAGWRLHLGTVDEDRYPSVSTNLVATPELADAAKLIAPGAIVEITNPPSWLPPDTIRQVVQGARVTLSPYAWDMDLNCTPASPWTVATVSTGVDEQRVDTGGTSVTTGSFDAGIDTALPVNTPHRPWITTQTPFLIKVAGVVLEVTAVTGAGEAQTLTVTQTPVNGVTKTIPIFSDVRLAHEPTTSL